MSLETLTPKKDEIAFIWFNDYAGVTIKTPTKTLVIDPADIDPKVFKTLDAILVTHEHYDHFDESIIRELHRRSQCLVVADSASAKRLKDAIAAGKLHEMRAGKEIKLDNVTIKAEVYKHPATAPVSYLITSEDGIRVYHTGDSLPHSGMRRIGEHNPPDIVFCTVGPPAPGASPQSGLEIVRMVKPKLAIPYHAPAAERKKFAELISRESPNVRCLIAEQNKPVTYP
jgi:L-ascorbate metabolism protein UlaG (beta-lactamase superfamily)